MFVMEILQEIVIHCSFDMIIMFAFFSGHTISVKVQTNRCLKFPRRIGDMAFTSDEILSPFLL